jgi:hypothetical protein
MREVLLIWGELFDRPGGIAGIQVIWLGVMLVQQGDCSQHGIVRKRGPRQQDKGRSYKEMEEYVQKTKRTIDPDWSTLAPLRMTAGPTITPFDKNFG